MQFKQFALATGTFLAIATAAQAGVQSTVDLVYAGTQRGGQVKVSSAFMSGDVFAGQILSTLSNGPAGYNGTFVTFCCDLGQYVPGSPTQYQIVDPAFAPMNQPMGVERAQALRNMYTFAGGAQLDSGASNDLAVAFQLAVWEIIYDFDANAPGFGLSMASGNFSALQTDGSALSVSVQAEVTSLLSSVAMNNIGAGADLVALVNEGNQDQLFVVPAPGAAALVGIAGLLAHGRRRR